MNHPAIQLFLEIMAVSIESLYLNNSSRSKSIDPGIGVRDRGVRTDTAGKDGIIVVIPCYNEEVAIGSIVLRALKYAEKVLVIDDGSSDNTAEVAKIAGAEVLAHGINMGKGACIRDAFEQVKMMSPRVVVLIDGDGQHDPDEIPDLVKPILSGEADIVNGSRFIKPNGHNVPLYRRIGQTILTVATNFGMGRKISDTQNGFRAFSCDTLGCFSLGESGMAIESEMLIDAAEANLRVREVPINVRYDVDGSTHNPIKHGFSVLNSIIILISQRRPMLFFGLPGALFLLTGLIFIFLMLEDFNTTRTFDVFYAMACMLSITLGAAGISTGLTLTSIHNRRTDAT